MSDKTKTVQIPFKTFLTLYKLAEGVDVPENEINALEAVIIGKMDALIRRALYSKYKNTELTAEERERARQKYLDMVGISDNFRW